jgi:exonuclease III
MEFKEFYLVAAYVPNSGEHMQRLDYRVEQWDPDFKAYLKELEKKKPVLLAGDLNAVH